MDCAVMAKDLAHEPVERRSEQRHQPSQFLVKLDPGNGQKPFTCFVWDLSASGIRLKLSENVELPRVVHVIIDNVRRPAKVIWRKGDHVGLSLLPVSA